MSLQRVKMGRPHAMTPDDRITTLESRLAAAEARIAALEAERFKRTETTPYIYPQYPSTGTPPLRTDIEPTSPTVKPWPAPPKPPWGVTWARFEVVPSGIAS